jgi:hypothetical protein
VDIRCDTNEPRSGRTRRYQNEVEVDKKLSKADKISRKAEALQRRLKQGEWK